MAKRSGLKIALIIIVICLGLALVAGLVCVGSGYVWFRNKAPELRETGQRAMGEADAFAQGHTQSDCIDEGFRRHEACGTGMALMCRTETRIFLRRCLDVATPTPGTCDGVPDVTEIMAGATWAVQFCRDHGRGNDQQCANFVRGIVEHCADAH